MHLSWNSDAATAYDIFFFQSTYTLLRCELHCLLFQCSFLSFVLRQNKVVQVLQICHLRKKRKKVKGRSSLTTVWNLARDHCCLRALCTTRTCPLFSKPCFLAIAFATAGPPKTSTAQSLVKTRLSPSPFTNAADTAATSRAANTTEHQPNFILLDSDRDLWLYKLTTACAQADIRAHAQCATGLAVSIPFKNFIADTLSYN